MIVALAVRLFIWPLFPFFCLYVGNLTKLTLCDATGHTKFLLDVIGGIATNQMYRCKQLRCKHISLVFGKISLRDVFALSGRGICN